MIDWPAFKYHPVQNALWNCKKRLVAAVAGRGSGKTEMARRKIILSLAFKKPWKDPIYAYCLPTFQQAKKVAWYPIISMIPKNWISKDGINKSESTIRTVFGSTLYVVGMDKPHRLEGMQVDGIVIDESSDQKPGMFDRTVMPMTTYRDAWVWRIGVPKRSGPCRAEFREFFIKGLGDNPNIASFTWKSSEVLSPEKLEAVKANLTQQDYDEQMDAKWVDTGGTIYYNFNKIVNVAEVKYQPDKEIVVGCDFNVNPMSWVLCHHYDGKLVVFDQVFLRNTNTVAALQHVWDKYQHHTAGWRFYGDASSNQRKTSASRTDYLIIKNDIRFGDKKIFFPDKNPRIKDRFASVNAAFKNAKGDVRLIIDNKCDKLITDFTTMSYAEGTSDPEDYSGTDIGHMSDALGYIITKIMPIRIETGATPVIISK